MALIEDGDVVQTLAAANGPLYVGVLLCRPWRRDDLGDSRRVAPLAEDQAV